MTREDLLSVYKTAKLEWITYHSYLESTIKELKRICGPMEHFAKEGGVKLPAEIQGQIENFRAIQRWLKRSEKKQKAAK